MAKFLILACLCICLTKNVAALDCYVTDLIALRFKGIGAEPVLKNCKTYFDDLRLGNVVDDFHCYWMRAETVQGHANLQGCLAPNVTCDQVKYRAELMGRMTGLSYENINCTMCATDSCNGGVEHTVVLKNGPNFGSHFNFGASSKSSPVLEPHYMSGLVIFTGVVFWWVHQLTVL